MALDGVPWSIGGAQAQHTAETARADTYAGTNGSEGVVTPASLKVEALNTPGTKIRVSTGSALVLHAGPDGAGQTYTVRAPTETQESVTATGSGGGRTDLVVLRIEDPNVTGSIYQQPADRAKGPYNFIRVLSNTTSVPAGMSAIPLAKITIPASTSTITPGMITDIRNLANPRNITLPPISAGLNDELLPGPNDNTFRRWPAQFTPEVDVPLWATHASLSYMVIGAGTTSANVDGALRLRIADITAGQMVIDLTGSSAGSRFNLVATASGPITTYLGQRAQVVLEGKLSTGALGVNPGSQALINVSFFEQIV